MSEVINLRAARKRAQRRDAERAADANRLAHGRPKQERDLDKARRDRADRTLDGHRRDGDGE